MIQNDQNREFGWPTTITTEILRQILHKIFEGCFRIYKGQLLYPGIGACAYKRGTFKFIILQIVKISFISAGTYIRVNRVSTLRSINVQLRYQICKIHLLVVLEVAVV